MKGDPTSRPNSVMVLSAAAATGHLRAAEALVSAFEAKRISAHHIEVLRYTNPIFRKIYSDLYVELMTRGPNLLGWLYKTFDRPWQFQKRRIALDRLNTGPLVKLLVTLPERVPVVVPAGTVVVV